MAPEPPKEARGASADARHAKRLRLGRATHIHIYTYTQIHRYTYTQIHRYTDTQIHIYTDTQIHRYKDTQIHISGGPTCKASRGTAHRTFGRG